MTTTTLPRLPASAGAAAPLPRRAAILVYGSAVYALFLATFLYLIGFVAGAFVPKHIDSGPAGPIAPALLGNALLLGLFAVQHAIMARPWWKQRWTRIVPVAAERSTFVLTTCMVLAVMVWFWQPLPGVVWRVEGAPAVGLHVVAACGWAIVLVSTFLIDHFELFGLRQVVLQFVGRPYTAPRFRERALYKLVRHPLMLGFLIAFWAAPVMTVGHLFFAAMCTAYILVGVRLEERDLVRAHGSAYRDYRRRVRGLLPLPRRVA